VLSPDSSVLYVGSNGKEFIALRTSDGKQLWSVPAGRWVYCSPTLTKAGDVVYYGSDDHYMRAVNTTDGAIIWSFEAGGEMTSKPALSPNEDGKLMTSCLLS
jgi:outer membrane protein assembly factor BamB